MIWKNTEKFEFWECLNLRMNFGFSKDYRTVDCSLFFISFLHSKSSWSGKILRNLSRPKIFGFSKDYIIVDCSLFLISFLHSNHHDLEKYWEIWVCGKVWIDWRFSVTPKITELLTVHCSLSHSCIVNHHDLENSWEIWVVDRRSSVSF